MVDFDRARAFYEAVLQTRIEHNTMGDMAIGFFPRGEYVGGALIKGEGYAPAQTGTLVYLNADGDLDGFLGRVEAAGGAVVMPRTSIGEHGWIARFTDTEGNLVAAHSM